MRSRPSPKSFVAAVLGLVCGLAVVAHVRDARARPSRIPFGRPGRLDTRAVRPGRNDAVCGGPGKDGIDGGTGSDTLFGHGGDDTVDGAGGTDVGNGGPGNDVFTGCETTVH